MPTSESSSSEQLIIRRQPQTYSRTPATFSNSMQPTAASPQPATESSSEDSIVKAAVRLSGFARADDPPPTPPEVFEKSSSEASIVKAATQHLRGYSGKQRLGRARQGSLSSEDSIVKTTLLRSSHASRPGYSQGPSPSCSSSEDSIVNTAVQRLTLARLDTPSSRTVHSTPSAVPATPASDIADLINLHAVHTYPTTSTYLRPRRRQQIQPEITSGNQGPSSNEGHGSEGDDYLPELPPLPERAPAVEDTAPSVPQVRENQAMAALCQPKWWCPARMDMNTLGPGLWMDASVINYYLLRFWLTMDRPKAHYFDSLEMQDLTTRSEERQRAFREVSCLPLTGPCPVEAVCCVVTLPGSHHFVVVFDIEHLYVHILGRFFNLIDITNPDLERWEEFYGPALLDLLLWLYGWPAVDPIKLDFNWQSWVQTGGDCGPTAIQVVEEIITFGLQVDVSNEKALVQLSLSTCMHLTRLKVFQDLQQATMDAYQSYMALDSIPEHWISAEALLNDQTLVELQSGQLLSFPYTFQDLKEARSKCRKCQERKRQKQGHPLGPLRAPRPVLPPSLAVTPVEEIINPALAAKKRRLRKLMSTVKELAGARLRGSEPGTSGGAVEEDLPLFDSDNEPTSQAQRAAHAPPVNVPAWLSRSNAHHPLALPPPELPVYVGQKYLPHRNIDDYEGAPTIEEMENFPEYRTLAFFEHLVRWSCWTTFRDYGYRLLASFHQNFYLEPPSQELLYAHIMRRGLAQWTPSEQMSQFQQGRPRLACHLEQEISLTTNLQDVTVVSISDMLSMIYNVKSEHKLVEVIVCGRETQGMESQNSPDQSDASDTSSRTCKYLVLDLELDAVRIGTPQIEISVDVDSLIWIGRLLSFKSFVNIFTVPMVGRWAPIRKSNSAWAEIVVPPSAADKESVGSRTEYYQRRTPLSSIPHTHFLQITSLQAKRSVNGYLFFPRMQHRHEYTGHWDTFIPYPVQCIFWNEILLPSLSDSRGSEMELAYMPPTVDYQLFKTRTATHQKGDYGKAPTCPIHDHEFDALQHRMRELIKSNTERYGIYDSFFIVLEAKGVKHITVTKGDGSPLENLKAAFPSLDFDYLCDRTKGELILDVGVTLQPPASESVVGLWRLEPLVASYEASGMTAGVTHFAGQLGRYGGMQAEMKQKRARQTHISKRISYNLEYEVTRPASNQATVIPNSDAYHLTEKYLSYWETRAKQYRSAKKKSYGCRDEYRAIEALEFGSIIWLPSDLWFEFMASRVEAIVAVQTLFHSRPRPELRPDNYGLLTSILSNMLQSLGNTVTHIPVYTREALRDLQITNITFRFGMFFLQELSLDPENMSPLFGIEDADTAQILADMKSKEVPGGRRKKRLEAANLAETYPLGSHPTVQQVNQSIKLNPHSLMRPWSFDTTLDIEPAATLFTKFCEAIWCSCHREYRVDGWVPRVTCLREAMELWTVDSVFSQLHQIEWKAIYPRGSGAQGRPDASFRDRWRIFFPVAGLQPPSGSPWGVFYNETHPWYICDYHQFCEQHGPEEVLKLDNDLANIFEQLPCLPSSSAFTSSTQGKIWMRKERSIVVLTNPLYYHMEGISTQSQVRSTGLPAAQAPRRHLQEDIRVAGGLSRREAQDLADAQRKYSQHQQRLLRLKQRSGKARNKRRPPIKKSQAAEVNFPITDDEEQDYEGHGDTLGVGYNHGGMEGARSWEDPDESPEAEELESEGPTSGGESYESSDSI